jgi:predicted membrane protein
VFGLIDKERPDLNLHNYIAPLVLIFLGLFFMLRRSRHSYQVRRNEWRETWRHSRPPYNVETTSDGEWIDSTSVFGGAQKVILSKNFRGGDITCFMGGAEIDLSQADIQGKVVMDITAVFGGVKLVVPPNWDVKVQMTAVFAGVEDKRPVQATKVDPDKLLIIDGAAVFGGIDINSY